MLIYKLAALVELSLVLLEDSGYIHLSGLPLGGGQVQQLGLVFASAYVISECIDLFKGPPRQPDRGSKVLARGRTRK